VQLRRPAAFQGLTAQSVQTPQQAARPDYADHVAHAALQPVKAYVSRHPLHDQIHAQLSPDAVDSSTKTLVVCRLGGAGKTQLVLDEYKATFWFEAGRMESLQRDFVRLY
jgi:hypothetical protein